ncbi:MAG: DNA-3-methyladenine glycosylase I [Gammaproteobacteria bacterium]|nr:DNA-3-methyladenine glycosylase I [Gammaproteobacteria bacterium]MBU0891321.1 DNA-3-methyladenine glycosylase I [Gammaproteobacteria bacterium]MBU1816179.1 DNA-3-methyladenine glycosylase I [Gammaproteobacteria bacterium]
MRHMTVPPTPEFPALPALPVGLFADEAGCPRCGWCQATPFYRQYHDNEWGFPVADDRRLFEKLCLEGFQSGLSWLTILNKREGFRAAFANFDAEKVAAFGEQDVERLVQDAAIVRHRGKITSTINNAQRVLELKREFGSLAHYVWRHEPAAADRPAHITREVARTLSTSPASIAMSKDLKKRGWSFVGPTTVYAFMQAMGLVNDHLEGCHSRALALKARAAFVVP